MTARPSPTLATPPVPARATPAAPPGFGRVEALLLLVAIVWGGSYTAAKTATLHLPVMQFLALRFGLSFVLLLPALRGLAVPAWPAALLAAALLGLNLLAVFVCETFGLALTSASNAAFLISLCVAFTPLCEWWLLGQRPRGVTLAACAGSLLGAGLLAFPHGLQGATLTPGDGLVVLAALLRAVMVCMTRRHGQRHGLPALTLTAVQMGVMALGAALLVPLLPGPGWQPLPGGAAFWGAMAFLVLACTLLAFFVQNHAAGRTSPSRVALLMGSEPLWGALIAALCLGERLTPLAWAGGLLIVLSAWWATRPARPRAGDGR